MTVTSSLGDDIIMTSSSASGHSGLLVGYIWSNKSLSPGSTQEWQWHHHILHQVIVDYRSLSKIRPSPGSYCKGHWLLESMPTQQTKIISSSMLVMKSIAYMCVWASSWSGCNRGAVQSDHTRLVLTRDTTAQDVSDSCSCSDFCTMKSCSRRWMNGCHGSGRDREASSKQAKRTSYLQKLLFLLYCFADILFVITLQIFK